MSPQQPSILDTGTWEEIKPDFKPELKLSTQARATKWATDFMRPSIFKEKVEIHEPLRRTAYLDGLRGFAAFLVYWQHHQFWARDALNPTNIFENGYGYDGQYYFACLPVIRTFFSGGHFAVTVFFVISGYVLSTKPLSLIHNGDFLKLSDNLASALFRRWLRLFLPVIATTFMYMTCWHAFGIWTDEAPHAGNWRDEVWNWYAEFKNFSFVFTTGGNPWFAYNHHVWSIPVEFKGSIIIYTSLLAFSRCTRNARLWCEVGLIIYFMYIVDGFYGSMFMSGMLLCDLDLLAASDNLPSFFTSLKPYKTAISYTMLGVSTYLSGVPSHTADVETLKRSPGWYYLASLKPQAVFDYKWYYLFWASLFFVAAVPRIWWLKSFFELRFNQYLGRISYAFYLMHGPVLWTIGDRLYVAVGWSRESHALGLPRWINAFQLSSAGPLGLEVNFLAVHLITLPLTFWLAEMVTKVVDEPSVRFAQWLYRKTLAPSVKL